MKYYVGVDCGSVSINGVVIDESGKVLYESPYVRHFGHVHEGSRKLLQDLVARFEEGMERFVSKGFDRELLLRRALITPSCGAGGVLTEALAERVLGLLREMSATLRSQHGFDEGSSNRPQ